jgi:hypothetical protein
LQQNTVNDGLPAREDQSLRGREVGAIRLMVHLEQARAFPPWQLSTLPNPYC